MARTPLERFLIKCTAGPNGCILWVGAKSGTPAYGCFYYEQRLQQAHVVSWKLFCGSLPKGVQVLHHCDVPLCVNPAHLFVGSQSDNMRDALSKGRLKFSLKLTNEQVAAIIEDKRPQKDIAAAYGITQGHVSNLKNGRYQKIRGKIFPIIPT